MLLPIMVCVIAPYFSPTVACPWALIFYKSYRQLLPDKNREDEDAFMSIGPCIIVALVVVVTTWVSLIFI